MASDTSPTITHIKWTDDIDAKLSVSGGDDLPLIKDQVVNGIAKLWECKSDKNHCFVVTRKDHDEICIVLGEGSGLMEFAPYFIRAIKDKGLRIRTHVRRKGLIRMWSRLGLNLSEYVLRD